MTNEKSYRRFAGVKTTRFLREFQTFKKTDFLISGFLDFLLDFWLYLGNKKSYRRSAGVKSTGFFRATGDLLASKRPDFRGFSDFCVSAGFLAISQEGKELP